MQPRSWLAFCDCALPGHVEFAVNQRPQVLLLRTAFNPFFTPACIYAFFCPVPGSEPCTWPCWTLWGLQMPLLKPAQVPVDDIPSFQSVNHTTQTVIISKLAQGALSASVLPTKISNSFGPYTNAWGTPLTTVLQLDMELLTCEHPSNSVPTEWSINQISVFTV